MAATAHRLTPAPRAPHPHSLQPTDEGFVKGIQLPSAGRAALTAFVLSLVLASHGSAQVSVAIKPSLSLDAIVVQPISASILTVSGRLGSALAPSVSGWVQQEAASLVERKLSVDAMLPVVREDIAARFAGQKLAPGAADALAVTVLTRVATITYEQAQAMRAKLASANASMQDMNNADMFALQRFMDQKSQLESMISNVMMAMSTTQNSLVSNLK
jgi:hypothetical protein